MKNNRKPFPFQSLTLRQWWRLGVVSILLTYLLIFTLNIKMTGLFNYVGLDYRTFYTSAQIAFENGFTKIYDIKMQESYQRPLYEIYRTDETAPLFETVPTPYLPIFVLPFFLFLPFSPLTGFILFTAISIIIFALYTRHLISEFKITEEPNWIIIGSLAFIAFFFNLFFGQINVFLYIFLGEFILSVQKGRDFSAGLFLASWLIKPQTLIFILPWLLVIRRFRILAGFGAGSLIILISSTLIAKGNWLMTWINLLLLYPRGLATTNPLAMMNWRSLALNLELVIPPLFAWAIAITGMILTVVWMIKTWKNQGNESQFAVALLGSYAATCAVTWHAHIHMALPLLAPIMVLLANNKFTYKMWVAFIGFQFLGLAISIAARIWFPVNNLLPMTILAINVYLTQWSSKEIKAYENISP
jgi:hypothetical protein